MYTPFIIYCAVCVVAIALASSKKFRCWFAAILLGAIVFAGVLSLHGAARAEIPQERTCWVEQIHFHPDYIDVKDEDGYHWLIPFWKGMDISVGEEYTLYVDLTAENQYRRSFWLDAEVE